MQLICWWYTINKIFPGSNIVFSNILPRKEWHYSNNHRAMKDFRKHLNRGKYINWKNKETVDIQPISFPPQWQMTAFGSPKQLFILWTTGTIDDHRILGFPIHITFKAVICHCGGNEIGCMSTVSLFFQLICSLYTINKMFPGSNIVFSNILPRKEWHYSNNHRAMTAVGLFLVCSSAWLIFNPYIWRA
jgi:hypothetical protein